MRNFIVGLCMALVTGCASMATPETVNQKIAYVYAGLTAAADSTTDLLKRDRISVKTAQSISDDLDTGHFLVLDWLRRETRRQMRLDTLVRHKNFL